MLTRAAFRCLYPKLAAEFTAYTQTRKGKKVLVRRGKTRVKVSGRGSLPLPGGEGYARAAASAQKGGGDVKEKLGIFLNKRGGKRGLLIRGQGNLAGYQVKGATYLGYKPKEMQRDAKGGWKLRWEL